MREKEKDKERQRERERERERERGGIEIQSFISLFIKRLFERGRENIKWYLRERGRQTDMQSTIYISLLLKREKERKREREKEREREREREIKSLYFSFY